LVFAKRFRLELASQGLWPKALDTLELPIKVRVVSEANSEADIQDVFVGFQK
jgi:hypothetical protein